MKPYSNINKPDIDNFFHKRKYTCRGGMCIRTYHHPCDEAKTFKGDVIPYNSSEVSQKKHQFFDSPTLCSKYQLEEYGYET